MPATPFKTPTGLIKLGNIVFGAPLSKVFHLAILPTATEDWSMESLNVSFQFSYELLGFQATGKSAKLLEEQIAALKGQLAFVKKLVEESTTEKEKHGFQAEFEAITSAIKGAERELNELGVAGAIDQVTSDPPPYLISYRLLGGGELIAVGKFNPARLRAQGIRTERPDPEQTVAITAFTEEIDERIAFALPSKLQERRDLTLEMIFTRSSIEPTSSDSGTSPVEGELTIRSAAVAYTAETR